VKKTLNEEAKKLFSELKTKKRFYNGFREAEILIYKQREKMISLFSLMHYIKNLCPKNLDDCIEDLEKEQVIKKQRQWYKPTNIKLLFRKEIKEEKEIIEELGKLGVGGASYIEALEIVLLNERLDDYRNRMKNADEEVKNILKKFLIKEDRFTQNKMIKILEVNNKYLNNLKREINRKYTS